MQAGVDNNSKDCLRLGRASKLVMMAGLKVYSQRPLLCFPRHAFDFVIWLTICGMVWYTLAIVDIWVGPV